MAITIGERRRHERNHCFCKKKEEDIQQIMVFTKQNKIIYTRNYNDRNGKHAKTMVFARDKKTNIYR